jgi:signal transduction histidine kinase
MCRLVFGNGNLRGKLRTPLQLRSASVLVLIGVLALAVGGFFATKGVVADQERKLLKQRTDEAAVYLSSALSSIQTKLSAAATSAAVAHSDPAQFAATNASLANPKTGFGTVALVSMQPTPHVVAAAGVPIDALTPTRLVAITRASATKLTTGSLYATPRFRDANGQEKIGFAFATPELPGFVVYAESTIHLEAQPPVTASQPFSELVAAVYAVPKAVPNQVIISSVDPASLPLRGQTAHAPSPVGDGQPWLLVAKARRPLVGSVALAMPWALLGAGLLAALLAAAVVETLARRRAYAEEVADTRTRELQQSMVELAEAHEQLVRQERLAAIGELASSIGHELRNPLAVVSNALYLLRGDLGPNPSEAASRHFATAEREVSAATVIVSDLLEFTRQRQPVVVEVDLAALIAEVLTVLPPPAAVTVERDVPDGLRLMADRDMLRQVLLNLVGNAYQALVEGGTVTVGANEEQGSVRIWVSDNGPGVATDMQEKIFQPFVTTKARGVGLGLAVTRRIVAAHSGTLELDPAASAGARFVVTLPAGLRLPRQTAPVDTPSEARTTT